MAPRKIQISQSLIKDLDAYFEELECGHLVYQKYVRKLYDYKTSDALNQGSFFEYLATGGLPKSKKVPKPDLLKDGKTLSAAYRRAEEQALLFKRLCNEMGIKILGIQEKRAKNGLEGTRDILATWEGREITIDLKYSGLINNQWDVMGWNDIYIKNERGKQYPHHSTQSLQYSYIFELPFYFWIFSSVNVGENIMLEMIHDDDEKEQHLERAKDAQKKFAMLAFREKAGISAIPEYNRCKACILFDNCDHKTLIPIPKRVSIS